MNIYTLNVGQGQFVIVKGQKETVIVDTYVPLNAEQKTTFVVGALAKVLKDTNMIGVIFTGFDEDHFCDVGVKLAVNRYQPDWVMYPRTYKKTKTATSCFETIDALEAQRKSQGRKLLRLSIDLADKTQVRIFDKISSEFIFEVFSPHKDDMTSSNNSSIVCKITERASGAKYLVTGDTEVERWKKIVQEFKGALTADALQAPHHGSSNGITAEVLEYVTPHTVIASAGVESQYGHPSKEAVALYNKHATKFFQTNVGEGQSLRTWARLGADGKIAVDTYKFEV